MPSEKAEIWSLGVLAWELFCIGTIPYAEISEDELLGAAIASGLRLAQPPSCPPILWHTIVDCWDPRPVCRPSASHIGEQLSHIGTLCQYCRSYSLQLPDCRLQSLLDAVDQLAVVVSVVVIESVAMIGMPWSSVGMGA